MNKNLRERVLEEVLNGTTKQVDIAHHLGVTQGAISQTLRKLERYGLVERPVLMPTAEARAKQQLAFVRRQMESILHEVASHHPHDNFELGVESGLMRAIELLTIH